MRAGRGAARSRPAKARKWRLRLLALTIAVAAEGGACAQTLKEAALLAIASNPALAARRSAYLATRQKLPQAFSGYLPRLSASADYGYQGQSGEIPSFGVNEPYYRTAPHGVGLELTQTLFDGFKTPNAVAQAHLRIGAGAAALDDAEQDTLFAVATAYVSVLRDRALLAIAQENVEFIQRQSGLVNARHAYGDVTATDLALARSRLAGARIRLDAAEASERASEALYRATIGAEPGRLVNPAPVDSLSPTRFDAALALALRNHPSIAAAEREADAAEKDVKIAEADFYPTASVSVSAGRRSDVLYRGDRQTSTAVIGRLSIPIFDGGLTSARTSEARAIASQRRLEADSRRQDVRSALKVAWSRLLAARAQTVSAEAQTKAAETALSGTMQEYTLGARATSDILDSEQEYATARAGLVTARAERVLASYALARAIGVLMVGRLPGSAEGAIAIDARNAVASEPPPPLRLGLTLDPEPRKPPARKPHKWGLRLDSEPE